MSTSRVFRDRRDAGRILAGLLGRYRCRPDVLVLGLARGGVPVAYEVARELRAPLDVLVVRKLGVPGQEDLAMGAITGGATLVLDDDVVRGMRLPPDVVRRVAEHEGRELARQEQAYRDGRPVAAMAGRTVLLIDDGLATGVGTRAAIASLRRSRAARVVVAVPAAPTSTCQELARLADEVVCATTPSAFAPAGPAFWDFARNTDEGVRDLLHASASTQVAAGTWVFRTEAAVVRAESVPVPGGVLPDDLLFDLVGDAELVLVGAASNGTQEFHQTRAAVTRRLIQEKGFDAVAVEADWLDAYRVNRFVRGHGSDTDAEEALRDFLPFPGWMWRNTVVLDFVAWLRKHNDRFGGHEALKTGFYGLDLYGTHRSAREIISFLDQVDPAAGARARHHYAGLDHPCDDGRTWGQAAAFGTGDRCEQRLVDRLVGLHRHAADRIPAGMPDDVFRAHRDARTVSASADYYRSMLAGRTDLWNARSRHMADTLEALAAGVGRRRSTPAKIVVWAQNAQAGDAAATEIAARGEVSVGQLVRRRHPASCRLLGLTTYAGTVTSADGWDEPARCRQLRPALPDSIEELFHEVGEDEFLVVLRSAAWATEMLTSARLERAVGAVQPADGTADGRYVRARTADQFDAVIHLDQTHAVEPVERAGSSSPRDAYPQSCPHSRGPDI